VKFLGVPELQQQITVTGYPIGGDSLSITQGIVSRVTMSPYTSGAAQLMNIQACFTTRESWFSASAMLFLLCFEENERPGQASLGV
jgi:hypothetical protein